MNARSSGNHSCTAFSGQLPSYDFSDTDHPSFRQRIDPSPFHYSRYRTEATRTAYTYPFRIYSSWEIFRKEIPLLRGRNFCATRVPRFARTYNVNVALRETTRRNLRVTRPRRALIAQFRVLIRPELAYGEALCVD